MALLNANHLGLYAFADSGQTKAYRVTDNSNLATAKSNFVAAADSGDYGLLVNGDNLHEDSNKPAIGRDNSGSWQNTATELDLLAAATSTTLDMGNTIDEIAARSTQGSAETYVVGGSQSWSLTADGLIQDSLTSDRMGPEALMDISRASEYIIVRFALDTTKKDDASETVRKVNYIGQGIIENVSISGGFDDTATYSVTVRGYGKLYKYVNA